MLIVMDMSSGRRLDEPAQGYDDTVLNAGWTALPRLEPRLELVTPSRREETVDPARFLAAFYAAQE